jgi:hypothetical protein
VSSLGAGRFATAGSLAGGLDSDPPAGADPMSEAALAISIVSDDGAARSTSVVVNSATGSLCCATTSCTAATACAVALASLEPASDDVALARNTLGGFDTRALATIELRMSATATAAILSPPTKFLPTRQAPQ